MTLRKYTGRTSGQQKNAAGGTLPRTFPMVPGSGGVQTTPDRSMGDGVARSQSSRTRFKYKIEPPNSQKAHGWRAERLTGIERFRDRGLRNAFFRTTDRYTVVGGAYLPPR